MAIEIVHSRTATLIDGSNPDEIQAADWNDTHPITGDGMGLLFSNSAGAVAETMTVDMGTLTASTPLTFKQTWEDATNTVAFRGLAVDIKTRDSGGLPQGDTNNSPLFSVRYIDGADITREVFDVTENRVRSTKIISLYDDNYTGTPVISVSALDGGNVLAGSEAASYCRIDPNSVRARSEDTGDTWQADLYGNRLEYTTNTGQAFQLPLFTTDAGTLTASSPYTFKQTWDNAAQDVAFQGVRVFVQDEDAVNVSGASASQYFAVQRTDGTDTYTKFDVQRGQVRIAANLDIYSNGSAEFGTRKFRIDADIGGMVAGDDAIEANIAIYNNTSATFDVSPAPGDPPDDSATYSATGITRSAATADFTLPISETALASWANVPTNTDIADGYSQCGIDTNTGDVYLAANVGGTIFKVQLT